MEAWLDGEKVGDVKNGSVSEHKYAQRSDGDCRRAPRKAAPAEAPALGSRINARRRLELRGEANGVTVYDDFAHHPTAILHAFRRRCAVKRGRHRARIIAVLEPRSNTMKMGLCKDDPAVRARADEVFLLQPPHSVRGGSR